MEFVRVELDEAQAGLRYENGVLVEILPPATRRGASSGAASSTCGSMWLRSRAIRSCPRISRIA